VSARRLGIYLHWPYCAAICPYCDFNVYRARGDDAPLVAAMLADLAQWREVTGPRPLTSIYFGGGTPSLMRPQDVAALIEACARLWGLETACEITLEANPTDAETRQFAAFAQAGVTRLSLGLQALDDASLKALGRWHSAAEGMAAARLARTHFAQISLDLIYARPHQSLAAWEHEMAEALALHPDHISPYQLTIEAGTAFERAFQRGQLAMPDTELGADFFELTQSYLRDAGYDAYEVSNHARGAAAQSRHNLLYWTSQDWLGIGPGAHGRLGWGEEGRRATLAHKRPKDYVAGVTQHGHALAEDEVLSQDAVRDEYWLMGLRRSAGVTLGDAPAPALDSAQILQLEAAGLVWRTPDHLGLTSAGRLVANRVIAMLLGG
jgi:oxygen-independent coproporphyrinogen-3 oxidase